MKTDMDYVLKITKVMCLFVTLLSLFNFENIKEEDMSVITTSSSVILPSIPKIIKNNETTRVDSTNVARNNKQDKVIKTYYGNISHYGPDCKGCKTSLTASGYDISNGNIYYNDSKYGIVRIIAGDKKIPFGTIVKMNINNQDVLAIMLDTGDIGFNKKYMFDLLDNSEKEANMNGVNKNVKIEVLRFGF